MFSNRDLRRLLIPLIFEQLLACLMGVVDTIMVTRVGDAAISAVSCVNTINTLVLYLISALSAGGTIICSQYLGRKDRQHAIRAAEQVYLVALGLSVLLSAVCLAFRTGLLKLIFGQVEDAVMAQAQDYFLVTAFSYPFLALSETSAAQFRAGGNARLPMVVTALANGVNIGGNAILIFGFGMGVMGAALASLVSRAIACAAVLYLLQKPDCALRVDSLRAMAPNGGLIRRILRVGIPAGIENGMFQIGKLSVSSLTSTLGTAAIAANAVANTTTTFLNIPANAVGMAALTVVGQCLGAGEKEQAVYYSRRLMLTAYCGAWVMNLSAFFFANRFAVSLFNLSPEAQAMALDIMVWFNIVSLFVWPSSFTLPNILRAAGDARFTMTVSIVSMWTFRVGFCYLAVLCFGGGLLSIWMGMYLDWVFRSLCFYLRFRRGSWLEQSVI